MRDPQIGPLVVCGIGGSLAEALSGTTVSALAPLSPESAIELVRSCPPLLRGLGPPTASHREGPRRARRARGPPAEIAAVDINPLRVAGGTAVALDALIVLEETTVDLGLTPAQQELQARAAAFVDEELIPLEVEAELAHGRLDGDAHRARAGSCPRAPARRRQSPRELGGQGWTAVEAVLVHEELGRSTNAIWWAVEGGYNVLGLGTPAQIDRYLARSCAASARTPTP